MGRIEEIEKEITKLRNEKEKIIKDNRKSKMSEYRNSIDVEKVKEFYKKYNELCKSYDMDFKEIPYGYGSYKSISRISDGKVLCSIDSLNRSIVELSDGEIEDIVF